MALFGKAKTVAVERRVARRVRVDCDVALLMPSGNRTGRLHDISEDGARILSDNAPARGSGVILEWLGYEAYAHVVWSRPDGCGLEFDRPLPGAIVNETAARAPVGSVQPATPHGRIRPVC